MKITSLLATAAFTLAATAASAAVVVDFDDLAAVIPLGSVTDNGYTFDYSGPGFAYVWVGDSPNANGTNNLILGYSPSDAITVTKVGGGSFKLQSVDMAISWYSPNTSDTVSVNGSSLGITDTLTTYAINQSGTSLTITGLASDSGYWTADNFVFSGTPEPTSWALMVLGLGGIGASLRSRRKLVAAA